MAGSEEQRLGRARGAGEHERVLELAEQDHPELARLGFGDAKASQVGAEALAPPSNTRAVSARKSSSLLAYAPVGLITMGHFLGGNPDIPAFFYATIFTDLIAGLAVLGFAVWSLRATHGAARLPG